ncbi:MAG: siderophore-interacting protein, partial [Proteobacteria bacterium]
MKTSVITPYRTPLRVMHEVKRRTLHVNEIENLSPSLRKIILSGDELRGFKSLSPDDHIKVFFPYPGEKEPVLPEIENGQVKILDPNRPPIMRDYTPRKYNEAANTLELIFVLHEQGAASDWARNAQVGDPLSIGGPKGSNVVPYHYDGYIMIGDETAIPSILRRLEELPDASPAVVIIEVENASHELPIHPLPSIQLHWIHRNGGDRSIEDRFLAELKKIKLPSGDFFT